jgi:splicing factor U2AF subunit
MSAGDPNTKVLRELYIGNIPPQMNESQLQMFLNQQMTMRNLTKAPGNPCVQCRISNGFAFAEFRSVDETNLGVAHLNNVEIMGTTLRVGRPKKYEDQVPIEEQQRVMREAQNTQIATMSRMQDPTNCLQLSNMISATELADAEERADIEEDIKMELTKYGEVKDIQLPVEGPGACNVYVKFTEVQHARVARAALQGRKFGEGSVDVWFYDPPKFDSREWQDMKQVVCTPAIVCARPLTARLCW